MAFEGSAALKLAKFCRVRDEIDARIKEWLCELDDSTIRARQRD